MVKRLKVLHIGNVGNNAYINASIMNRRGYDCDVAATDILHAASSPDWYELALSDVDSSCLGPDPYFPNLYALGKSMPRVADWVAHGPFMMTLIYLRLKRKGSRLAHTALSTLSYLRFKSTVLRTMSPYSTPMSDSEFEAEINRYPLHSYLRRQITVGRRGDKYLAWIRERILQQSQSASVMSWTPPLPIGMLDQYFASDPTLEGVVRGLRKSGLAEAFGLEYEGPLQEYSHLEGDGFKSNELIAYCWTGRLIRDLVSYYDVSLFYGGWASFAYSAGIEGYCALEHGTIRSLPFEATIEGRMVKFSYLRADRVFITNTDYAVASPRLEFGIDQRVYIPHPFDEGPITVFKSTFQRRPNPDATVFFCPARQDWTSNDPKMAKANDRYFRAARLLLDKGRTDFVLHCVDWGIDRDASRALVEELGLERQVMWSPMMVKREVWANMLDADAVIDQFLISVLSSTGFEVLALGCRLISYDDGSGYKTFFGEAPPTLSARSVNEIADVMLSVMCDRQDAQRVGERSAAWVQKYHSANRIFELMEPHLVSVSDSFRAKTEQRMAINQAEGQKPEWSTLQRIQHEGSITLDT